MLFLDSSSASQSIVAQGLTAILAESNVADMPSEKKQNLMARLQGVLMSASFGQLLTKAITDNGIQAEALEQQTGVPAAMIKDLQGDAIYPNNVPVVLFRRLLTALEISFKSAERAIRQTFEMLQSHSDTAFEAGLVPAFKKGNLASRESFYKSAPPSDGKELLQNEEALDRYLNKLDELMKA
jgi:hypothetical protein